MSHQYNFAYLDESSKKKIRRSLLKSLAIPGCQVPYGGRQVPFSYGWGIGSVQVTASIIGQDDRLKVIDQGADHTLNALMIKDFFEKTTHVPLTEDTQAASLIQTRHRIPEIPLSEGQIVIFQVASSEPLQFIEPKRSEAAKMHAFNEYGAIYVKFYEDIARFNRAAPAFDCPVSVNQWHIMSPSPIPKHDNPKLNQSPALHLFASGKDRQVYAIPPYTDVVSLEFEDRPAKPGAQEYPCAICGATDSFLDEMIVDDQGTSLFICSDTEYCSKRSQEIES